MKKFLTYVIILFNISHTSQIIAQDNQVETQSDALFVFLDCNARNCDFDHFRRQIPWVNWVRDRTQSDIHLLITNQRTASGGLEYTLDFIGREEFTGKQKSIVFQTDPNATDPEVRNQLTNMMALGLVEFVQNNKEIMSRLTINYEAPDSGGVSENTREDDPWNLWVFRVGMSGGMDGEAQQSGYEVNGFANARRIDENYKFELSFDGEYSYEEFDDLEEGETYTNTSEDYSMELLSVWSLSPHSSIGGLAELSKSTFVNKDLGFEAGPAYEFNIFPYEESTRRLLTARYAIGIGAYDYELETIQGKTDDLMALQLLQLRAEIQQPWGQIYAFVEGIQYFAGYTTPQTPYRINTFLRLEYRIFRGFEIDIFGRYSSLNDQFYLPAEGLTQEEILLRRRQRETNFRFNVGVGLSYRFGSKFANVVNPRMD